MERIKVIIDWDENYGAASSDVSGCVATGKTVESVKEAYASALAFHLEGLREHEYDIPDKLKGEYTLTFELSVQSLLHQLDGIITRAALARATGINERQLGHYMTGHRTPRTEQRKKIVEGIHRIGNEFIKVV
ncbi:MAG: type II toxin-antitoxin system HicB family antitoxin [Tannerellaceae bacterium]|jgi:predicted RNase H-like HicB family nuclease|nr:type II toxin-antitoxin system HicB family antitoxin [Tannerellaceae bacterium]